ncbi:MAG: phosphatase PAP2 family protein [Gemmatimonadales bacterium]
MQTPRIPPAAVVVLIYLGATGSLEGQHSAPRDSSVHATGVPLIGLGFAAGALAAAPFDAGWAATIRGSRPQESVPLRNLSRVGNDWGSPGAIVAAGALWLGSRALHDSLRSRLGARALESLVLSGVVTGAIKGLAGRARPVAAPGEPGSWAFGRGIREERFQSFPSGHATAAFAFASSITAQLARDRSGVARWAGPVLFSLATVTAFARTYDNAHWLSDVVAGAGVGTVSGLVVARWHDAHPASWIDTILLGRRD